MSLENEVENANNYTLDDLDSHSSLGLDETVNVAAELTQAEQGALLAESQKLAALLAEVEQQTEEQRRQALISAYITYRRCGGYSPYILSALEEKGIVRKSGVRLFSPFVKLVFGLTLPSDATKQVQVAISRRVNFLATVLDGIDRSYGQKDAASLSVDEIATWMLACGGTEAVAANERQADQPTKADALDEAGADERMRKRADDLLARSPIIAQVDPATMSDPRPLGDFLVYARLEDGKFVFRAPFGNKQLVDIPHLLDHAKGTDVSAVPDIINFMAELTDLSAAIREGSSDQPISRGADVLAKSTKFLPQDRMIVVRDAGKRFVVSLGRSMSHVVMHAKPKFDIAWPVAVDCVIDTKTRRWFEEAVSPEIERASFDCRLIHEAEEAKRLATLQLTDRRSNKTHGIYFRNLANLKFPLLDVDVERYLPSFSLTLDTEQLKKCNDDFISVLKGKFLSKTTLVTTVTFDESGWTFQIGDSKPYLVSGSTVRLQEGTPTSIEVFTADLVDILRKLRENAATNLVFKVDPSGLLEISAETKMAGFTAFIPTLLRSSNAIVRKDKLLCTLPTA